MKRLFLLFVLSCFLCYPAIAQDSGAIVLTDDEIEEELNEFGFPDKSLVKVIEAQNEEETSRNHDFPACDNAALLEQVRQAVSKYIDFSGSTILTKRKALLTLKNIDNFITLPQEEVGSVQHRIVAARLIELKINDHIAKADIEFCQSDNLVLKTKLYLVMYPTEDGKTKVEILNFAKDIVPTFIFEE